MAAPFQNYSGGVLLADIVKRNNFSAYVSEAIKERSAFIQSGAVVRNALLDATAGGTRIQVPEFNPVSPTEEIIDGTASWGTSNNGYLTPQKIGTGTQIATICHRGFAYAVDDVAVLAAGEDPMGHIRNQLADAINKLNSTRLFYQLHGLFGSALSANKLDLAVAASSGAAEANYLTAATVARGRSLLGERGEELDTIVVHPSVAYYLYQVGMLTFSTSALSTGTGIQWGGGGVGVTDRSVGQFAGMNVVVDSSVNSVVPGSSGHIKEFYCYLIKSGTVLEGVQSELGIEAERNILSKQDVMSVDYHSTYHIMGTKWNDAADNPTNSDLGAQAKWALTYDADLIPIVQLTVNTPLDNTTL
ncbi:major capsid protein [uncultured Mediterranean phage uvMED]|nr:major capsid protein [uncultured Mediterranean phage uvMED]